MAIEQLPAKLQRDLPAQTAIAIGADLTVLPIDRPRVRRQPSTGRWPRLLQRACEILPGALALFLISVLVWGYVWFPSVLAVGLLIFDIYWLWKSWTIAFHVFKGVRIMRQYQSLDWHDEYRRAAAAGAEVLDWDRVHHVVIIPNYRESVDKLRDNLRAMAEAEDAATTVVPVLAMEGAEPDAHEKAQVLASEFAGRFADLIVTFHPAGIPGEVRGKSSNQAWAARCAVAELVGRHGWDLDLLTVTSCDADTIFPPQYFQCLRFKFATDAARYRRFWQAPVFFYNNIWQVPALLRVPNALGGLIHLSRLSRKRRVLFSQSTYSLSMRMAHDVGYWDTDVIPEDWHMFLKCYYNLDGEVDVEPIHLPIGNDGALSRTLKSTFVNQYLQVRRWAWGAVDIPFVVQEALRRREIPLGRRLIRAWYLLENHIMWSTQWWFVTVGGLFPWAYHRLTDDSLLPSWVALGTIIGVGLPGWITIYSLVLTPCLIPYAVIIIHDWKLRPPAPQHFSLLRHILSHACWLAISPVTFLFSALPALDSQVRLVLGRRMEYRVTEKV